MKIRIKGNFVRFRLTKSEVASISEQGYLEEQTVFGPAPDQIFTYALQSKEGIHQLEASFENNRITLFIPAAEALTWYHSERVGFENDTDNGTEHPLHLLLEKDFVCLDETAEDQSDNYPNPLAHEHP
jgi:hypothetical protein